MYFLNYGLPKTRLDKCVKSAVSPYPSTRNIVNVSNTLQIITSVLLRY